MWGAETDFVLYGGMTCSTIVEELKQENLSAQKPRIPINHEAKLRPRGRAPLLRRDIYSILFA